jgi:hypothetical protein
MNTGPQPPARVNLQDIATSAVDMRLFMQRLEDAVNEAVAGRAQRERRALPADGPDVGSDVPGGGAA